MARIPQSFIDELIGRVDIVEVIDARVPLKKQGREYVACCPFHNEKTPSFTVSPVKQFYHCFGCGAHGTALGFLMAYEHLEFPEAVRELAERVGLPVPVDAAGEEPSSLAPLYEALDRAQRFFREQLQRAPAALEYLAGRGLSDAIAAEFGLGFAPDAWDSLLKALGADPAARSHLLAAGLVVRDAGGRYRDRFRARVTFPIRDGRGRLIGFGGRVIGSGEPKYLNSPETPLFHKGRELYGLYEARQALREIPRLVVVEGYLDVIALHQHGLRHAVATLGTATTAEHIQRLFRLSPEIVFCFDGDRAGRAAAWRALENVLPEARDGRQIKFLFLPEGEDPDSLVRKEGAERFAARLAASVPLSAFLLDGLAARTELSSLDGRARLVELARPLLARVPPGIYRDMLATELARRAQVDPEKLSMLKPTSGPSGAGARKPPLLTGPVRRALAYLLYRPDLAQLAGEPQSLAGVELKGMEVLKTVLEYARSNPHIKGATLLEHWRGTQIGAYLEKLAEAELITPPEALESEFRALMADLTDRRPAEQRLSALLQASRERVLDEAEKAELSRLLKSRPGDPKA